MPYAKGKGDAKVPLILMAYAALLGCVKNAPRLAACEIHFKREQTFSAAMFPPVIVIAPLDTVLFISG